VASLTLLLAFAYPGLAAGLNQTVTIDYQSGDYDLTYGDTYKVGIPAPKLVYTLTQTYGNWSISGFYGDSGCNTIDSNRFFSEQGVTSDSYDDLSYTARLRKYGIDLGYTFQFGKITFTPTLGYHETMIGSGTEFLNSGYTNHSFVSHEIKGVRLGAAAGYRISPNISVNAGMGFSVRSHYYERQTNIIDYSDESYIANSTLKYDFDSQSSSFTDYRTALKYQFNPHLAVQLKYSYERGSMDTTSVTNVLSSTSYHCGVFSLGGSYSF
jgi:hypothetical protein